MRVPADIWYAAHDFGTLVHAVSPVGTMQVDTQHLEVTELSWEDDDMQCRLMEFVSPREALAWLLFSDGDDARYVRARIVEAMAKDPEGVRA